MSNSTFDELLSGPVLATAKKLYQAPTEIQKQVIPVVLARHDVVAMSKTGSGKTASFLLPLIQILNEHSKITGCRGLILSPTRELSLQTARFFKKYAENTTLKSASLIGGDPLPPQFDALTQNPDVIIATPGRLLQIVAETSYSLSRVEILVIDEADQMFDLGLEDQLVGILKLVPENRQSLLFSATIPQLLAEFTQVNLKKAIVVRMDISELPSTLSLQFKFVSPAFKPALLLSTIQQYSNSMVFVGTRHHAEFLSALAKELGIKAGCIYGTMDQDERSSSLAAFSKGSVNTLFVTDVAARGLDIEGLDLVLNYDFPAKPKIFLHRSGRAGRAGRKGHVISFVTQDELPYYVGAREYLKGEDWTITRVSREEIEDEILHYDDALRRCHDLVVLKKGMDDGEKMYVKSRPNAKPLWLTLAKEVNIQAGANKSEELLLKWRPKQTIFEQVAASQKQKNVMKELRAAHQGHVKNDAQNQKPPEPQPSNDDEVTPEVKEEKEEKEKPEEPKKKRKERKAAPKKPTIESTRSKFFIDPMKELNSAAENIRDASVSSLQDKILDMSPDDRSGFLIKKKALKFGKSGKKEKIIQQIASEKQAFIRNAVSQVTGTSPRGEKYQAWVQENHKHIQQVGQEEKIIKTSKRRRERGPKTKVKSELKTAEQIERDRLIKQKHKLHDQGRHKEAAALNAKIYKHKKGKR
ncbi:ATP-dependent RNA helicase DDX54 [Histomonas meleagridis]|uniref:ATP-dependent RNA helicase DDX54 n=1 Tax=Histomonas meleagridis TaxID=135588 RepID=UPI00355A139B|nr:ATP-dependent RNA helicase DDX54 [Histomonas meleagridis]KAH0796959.1 ATP-dependent RNA helicase DDX54 [Histomonas meleagridis]